MDAADAGDAGDAGDHAAAVPGGSGHVRPAGRDPRRRPAPGRAGVRPAGGARDSRSAPLCLLESRPVLYAWWSAVLCPFWRAAHGDPRMWWVCGLAIGLGVLSKYPMIVLLVAWL